MATPIILDCDPGHDDAIALLLALGSPELELLGVTTTYGNQTLEKTTANALRVLELAGRGDVPVASGASAPLERKLVVAASTRASDASVRYLARDVARRHGAAPSFDTGRPDEAFDGIPPPHAVPYRDGDLS